MADTKISALTALTGASVTTADDIIPIVDTSVTTTKKITVDELGLALAPFIDSQPLIRGSADSTKKVRFEVDGITTGTTRVITVPDSDITLGSAPSAAAQSDQETGTSTTTYVSPGRQHFHPSAAKAWGNVSTPTTVNASYGGSASVSKTGTGAYTVTHGVTFSSANYSVLVSVYDTSNYVATITARNATTFSVKFYRIDAAALDDPSQFHYVCFGDI